MGANATFVEGPYAAFARGDIGAVIDGLDENVEWSSPGTLPHGGQFNGKDGVGEFFEGLGGAWTDLGLRIESVSEAPADVVIGVVRADGILRSGDSSGYGANHLFTLRLGKVVRFREYVDLDAPLGG
jgi:uncharacterized protein